MLLASRLCWGSILVLQRLTGAVQHFSSQAPDSGWGCGFKNLQMLLSHLLQRGPAVKEALFGGVGFVPDIGVIS